MKTTWVSSSLDAKLTGQYRRLFRNLGLLMLMIIVLAASAVVYFDQRQVEDLSRKLITSTEASVTEKLMSFFRTADSNLLVAVEQLQMTEGQDEELLKKLFFRLSPFLVRHEIASGIIIADVATGDEYFILKPKPNEPEFMVRHHFPKELGPDKIRFERWQEGEVVESWIRQDDYDPTTRSWYKIALEAEENEIVASEPYMFYALKEPGLTMSVRWRKRDTGRQFITGIDIVLSNISRITQAMRPTENGMVFVITKDLRLVGLPSDERFDDENAVKAAMLKPVTEVDLPVVQTAVAEWEQRGRPHQEFPFKVDGASWWAGFARDDDFPEQSFWSGTLVPESDFLGALSWQRNIALAAIVGLGVLAALILIVNTVRKIRQDVKEAVSHIGKQMGPFELLYKIGDGGNGTVYRARHALLKRPTAVKVMLPQFSSSASAVQRFKNEVQITSSLTHPNTVAVFDFGQTPEGTLYYAMEHLSGVTLEDLVQIFGPQCPTRVLRILNQVCGSLREAHEQGLIHRDIKPANIMLCERGGLYDVVKVLDFGLVKDVQQDAPELTQEGKLVGTPLYLAPELIADASNFSPASDLYALGGVGYYLLTGCNVFEGASAVEICAMHMHDAPLAPSQRLGRKIPADLEAIVMMCLAKPPGERPQSAEAMAAMLARCSCFADWSWQQAQQWWADNRSALPLEEHEKTHAPLSDTHLLVDTNGRKGP